MSQGIDDQWAMGDAYETYMGRWSRRVAREFLAWLAPPPVAHWLEIGCGTGALTRSICALCYPASIVACDQSASFVHHAQANLQDARVSYLAAASDSLPERVGGFDVIASGLVLNFIVDPSAALEAMRDRVRPGGVVGAYWWDYSGGVEFLRYFWEEAVSLDAGAANLDESRRFGSWQPAYVASLFQAAGLVETEGTTLVVSTAFASFDDYIKPFLGGAGPAPSYVASLSSAQRDALVERLKVRLPTSADGTIRLQARALALKGFRR